MDRTRVWVGQDESRLTIRDVDSVYRLLRIVFALPLLGFGIFILFVVASGAGMREACGFGQSLGKVAFLGCIGLVFGVMPIAVGVHFWVVREEIVIHSSGELAKRLLVGRVGLFETTLSTIRREDFRVCVECSWKFGTHYSLVVQVPGDNSEIFLLSLRTKADAQIWLDRVQTLLAAHAPTIAESEQAAHGKPVTRFSRFFTRNPTSRLPSL